MQHPQHHLLLLLLLGQSRLQYLLANEQLLGGCLGLLKVKVALTAPEQQRA
jgi:hypothetical protein